MNELICIVTVLHHQGLCKKHKGWHGVWMVYTELKAVIFVCSEHHLSFV